MNLRTALRTPSTAGHFELEIDGHATTAFLKSVDGGSIKANVIDEPIGPDNHRIKHTSVVDIDPFSLEIGLAGSREVLSWIQSSWQKKPSRRNGQITHADFNLHSVYEHEFQDALIVETTFPTLDGSSKEAGYLKLKLQPEQVKLHKGSGRPVQSRVPGKQKQWTASAFRLNLDGLDEVKMANKIDSFTIKQGVKKHYVGDSRFPEIEPTKIEFPHISGTIAAAYANKLFDWHERSLQKGQKVSKAETNGSLEFLSPDRTQTLFQIDLFEVGLFSLQIAAAQANTDQIKRVKFELYVGRMDLKFMAGFE